MSANIDREKAEAHAENHRLMLLHRKGKPGAFTLLYQRNEAHVRAYAATVLGPERQADIDEASSLVWDDLYTRPRIYKKSTPDFSAWMCVVTRHRCMRVRRERARRDAEAAAMTPAVVEAVRSSEERPDVTVERAEQRERLMEAVAQLGEKDREVARGLLAGKSYEEISEETGTNTSTLKMRGQSLGAKFVALLQRKKTPMALTTGPMGCDTLTALTAGGLASLDPRTRARCEEHASTCKECALHMAGVAAFYHSMANPGLYPRSNPEILERILAQAPPPKLTAGRLWLLYFGAVALASLGTGYALFRPKPEPTGLPKLIPNFPVGEPEDPSTYTTPGQWMAYARSMANRGRKAEAKVWAQKVLDHKTATDEIKAEARELMDEIDKH